MTIMKRHAALMALLGLFAAAGLSAADKVEKTLEMPADGLVRVENVAGDIEIDTWEENRVWVSVRPGRQVESVEIEQTAGGVRVVVHTPRNARRLDDSEVSLKVPRGASLEVRGVSADIEVDGSEADSIDLETVSGDVTAEAQVRSARLKTVSGDLGFEGSARRIVAETVSGEVGLRGVEGEIQASTVSGNAYIEAGLAQRCAVETVSGDAGIEIAVADEGRLEVKTMSGDLTISLPEGQPGEFIAQTYSGDIHTDFGDVSRSRSGGGAQLQHQQGSGGGRITAESFSGDVSIRSR
jgi:DUF4097 and DUF4098 domain-containing protein YvlB